jgi:hypothetical protein
MKWCVTFPEEDILIKRPSLKKACCGNKTAAAFLSYLLYHVSISQEYKRNAENINTRKVARGETPDQEVTVKVYRTQTQIIEEMDNEISDRTLRDTAIPLLVALGYIAMDESEKINVYEVHLDSVQAGINHPPMMSEVLPTLHQLADLGSTSDKYRKYFRRLAEILPTSSEVLPAHHGTTSDTKSGSRRTPQARSIGVSRPPKSNKNNNDSITRVVEEPDNSLSAPQQASSATVLLSQKDLSLTEDEIALISEYRKRQHQEASISHSQPFEEKPPSAASTESRQTEIKADHSDLSTFVHPQYRFITLDDPIQPTSMVVSLTPTTGTYYSPMEDEDRTRIAYEVKRELQQKGCEVSIRYEHEPEQGSVIVDVFPATVTAIQENGQPPVGETSPSAPVLARPASDAVLTDEIIVQLWEYLRCARYDNQRSAQLRAAHKLLGLRLPVSLSVDLLARVYNTFFDPFWKQKYGELDVSHLVDTERSGKIRIVRWLARLQAEAEDTASAGTRAVENLYGANGHTANTRMVMWNGRLIPEKQAYQEGYEGGFERFKKGDHPDDDLEATLKRLQAEGKLPVLEEVSNG